MPSATTHRIMFSERLQAYWQLMRLDKPTGTWLLLIPSLWGLLLHGSLIVQWEYFMIFTAGAILMRSAGCILNDLADRRLDAQVARTQSRPLASGLIHIREALLLLALLLSLSLWLLLQLNPATLLLGVVAVVLVIAYPFMKRITWWPQAFLGITFNWGILMASTATTGYITLQALALYAGCIFWTIGYDTIYAHQDREDDALIGVKSTARLFGTQTGRALQYGYGLFIIGLGVAGFLARMHPIYFLSVIVVSLHCSRQIAQLDINNPECCMRLFKSNVTIGIILAAGIITSHCLDNIF